MYFMLRMLGNKMQEVNSRNNTVCVFSGNIGLSTALATNGNIKTNKALSAQFIKGYVFSHFNATANLNAHFFKDINLCGNNVFLELVRRNAIYHHSARKEILLKNNGVVTAFCQVICTGQASWTCTNNGDFLVESASI